MVTVMVMVMIMVMVMVIDHDETSRNCYFSMNYMLLSWLKCSHL